MTHPPADTEAQRRVATDVVRQLREAGHEAWFVGGCVREMLLGHVPKDFDVTTDADPDRVEEIFDHVVEVGRRFGVMTVVQDEVHVEVATFRTEGSYSDGRRPDEVRFATAEEDVSRRDFTINALLHDPIADEIVDHVGGRADLDAGLIRTVGDPQQRFREDHLRLLRAVRFSARFGFALEGDTELAVRQLASRVAIVSPERIHEELDRMLDDRNRARAVRQLAELGLLASALPPLSEAADVERSVKRLEALPERAPSAVAWAALLAGAAEGKTLDELLVHLRFSNAGRKRIAELVRRRAEALQHGQQSLAKRRRFLADPLRDELVQLARAEGQATGGEADVEARIAAELEEHGATLPEPFVGGEDLAGTSLPRGPAYALTLERLFDEQLEGSLRSREEALSRLAELADASD